MDCDSKSGGWGCVFAMLWSVGLLTGCATSGQMGNVTFSYRNVDQSGRAARQPVAAGSELDIQLGPASNTVAHADFEVEGASSSNEEVLEIVSVESGEEGEVVRIRARRAGRSEVSVQTTAGDDAIEILVREVGDVRVAHWLEELAPESVKPRELAVLRGGTAQFRVDKRTSSGRKLAGRGLESHVTVEPESATVQTPESASSRFRVTVESGDRLTIRGEPGENEANYDVLGVERVSSLNLVAPRLPTPLSARSGAAQTHPITHAERSWNERFPQTDALEAGEKTWLLAVGTFSDGRRVVGLDGMIETETKTPKTCAIRPAANASSGLFGGGLVLVEAKAAGTCRVRATVGSASATYSFAVTRAE